VSATFEVAPDSPAGQWLEAQGLEQDEQLVLRRVLESSGKSKAFINGSPVTLTQLRELAELLVDIHGQHAHQGLLKKSVQRELLDAWAKTQPLVNEVKTAWGQWKKAQQELEQWREHAEQRLEEREVLRQNVREMKALGITASGWMELQAEHHRQAHAAELIAGADQVVAMLSEEENSARGAISAARHRLGEMTELDSVLKAQAELLESALIQVDEVTHALGRYAQSIECDEAALAELDSRISAALTLARRLRISPEQLEQRLLTDQTRLEELEVLTSGLELEKAATLAQTHWQKLAGELSQQRRDAGTRLEQTVTQTLSELAFAQGGFKVELAPLAAGGPHGADEVEFLISLHPAQPPAPLSQIASGGELSRISLAIQAALSGVASVPTLIFDEVDTGIGGRVAEIVGRLLESLGQKHQVMCVTHLPQVAACGQHHFTVTKAETPTGYTSRISSLGVAERVEELSRMLGGVAITEATRRHAAEMLGSRVNP
jgi:DNA repair protein RecN (Recombination protein N)